MVHSVELLFDLDTEVVIRRAWDDLRAAGLSAQRPTARPHVTLVVAGGMDHAVAQSLSTLLPRFPLPCRVGSALVFGRSAGVLARSIVPSAGLLEIHADACRLAADHLTSAAMPHTQPGDWSPHVTLGRRIPADRLGSALSIAGHPTEISGAFVGLRHWDGDARTEHLI